jgi:hypothetical protein
MEGFWHRMQAVVKLELENCDPEELSVNHKERNRVAQKPFRQRQKVGLLALGIFVFLGRGGQ